jgi:8-oxo-dGTP pyrophosphatase MutT (NUDIX family)
VLEAYFATLIPAVQREHVDTFRLLITSYVTDVPPPTEYVRSVRAVAFEGDCVLALRDAVGAHVLPGGRREAGETLLQTLERELLEETGRTVSSPRMIGVTRLQWLGERPPHIPEGSPDYPDFLWLIHAGEVDGHRPEALLHEPGEGVPVLLPLLDPETEAELGRSDWAPENRVFLAAALQHRRTVAES